MSQRPDRRAQLRQLYGFDFPDDLFAFWEFANRLRPLEPLRALDVLDLRLVGPFEVLAGRFDGRTTRYPLVLHWRYWGDPPEFFTVLAGGGDGLHWGWYLDDPAERSGCVASYYARDVFELCADGDNLFEAVRLHLELCCHDFAEYACQTRDPADGNVVRALEDFRNVFTHFATADRPETGAEYEERYAGVTTRGTRVVADTVEGMGIVVPSATYRPLSLKDKKLWRRLRKEDDPADLMDEARQALRDGFPGTALKLGKDLWATGGEQWAAYACDLLDAAYAALGRDVLRDVLRVHRAHRDLPSVDILENEEKGQNGSV